MYESDFHHVYSRGVGKQIIFEDDADAKALLASFRRKLELHEVTLYAWCLMENHFHLIVRGQGEAISGFMRDSLSIYAREFNKRHDRSGHVFQGKFGDEPITDDGYFLQAVRYVHQNPEKAGVSSTEAYRWSSYREYVGAPVITETSLVLDMLGSVDAFVRFHREESEFALREYDDARGGLSSRSSFALAADVLGEVTVRNMRSFPKAERNRLVARLRASGLSIRQIERATGISRSVVSRIQPEKVGQFVSEIN